MEDLAKSTSISHVTVDVVEKDSTCKIPFFLQFSDLNNIIAVLECHLDGVRFVSGRETIYGALFPGTDVSGEVSRLHGFYLMAFGWKSSPRLDLIPGILSPTEYFIDV